MTETLENKVNTNNKQPHRYPAHIRGMSWLLSKFPTKEPKINNFNQQYSGFSESFSETIFEAYSSAQYYTGRALKFVLGANIKGYMGAFPGYMLQEVALDAEQTYGIKKSPKTLQFYSMFFTGAGAVVWLLAFHHIFEFPWAKTHEVASAIDIYRKLLSEYTLFVEIPARALTLAIWKQVTGIAPAEFGYLYYKPYIEPKIKPYIEPTKILLRKNFASFKQDIKLSYSFYGSQLEPIKNFLSSKQNK
jgi:hypothetical protein